MTDREIPKITNHTAATTKKGTAVKTTDCTKIETPSSSTTTTTTTYEVSQTLTSPKDPKD